MNHSTVHLSSLVYFTNVYVSIYMIFYGECSLECCVPTSEQQEFGTLCATLQSCLHEWCEAQGIPCIHFHSSALAQHKIQYFHMPYNDNTHINNVNKVICFLPVKRLLVLLNKK
jgi:hypothetical protein